MTSFPVFTRDPRYLAAVAELPLAARAVDRLEGAIVVIPSGPGVGDIARRAQSEGAAALVIDARESSAAELETLRRELRVPVVAPRPRVRADVLVAVESTPGAARAVMAESLGASADRRGILQDTLAWARLLAGGDLSLVACEATPSSILALLERGDVPVSLTFSLARGGTSVIRAHTIGHDRVDVTIDDGALIQRVDLHGADGVRTIPPRWESGARLDLRRAIGAVQTSQRPTDLTDWAGDAALAERLVGA